MKVVLLHAFPLDASMWEPQREALAGYDVVAPTLYGRGPWLGAWAESLLAELDGELVLVGASMGGYCALAMARAAPERVRGLLLAGARAGADSPERREIRNRTIGMLREEGVEAWRAATPSDGADGRSADDFVAALEALRDRPDATDVVASLSGPLLVVVGEHDELLSVDEARAIAEAAPQGRLEVVDGAGHIVSVDQPERFNALLREFLAPWT